jgi:hypothetical protein
MPVADLPNPYEASRTQALPRRWSWPFVIWTWVMVIVTLITATPLALFAVAYVRHRQTGPPTFSGDPDIGYGILMMLVIVNAPTVLGWLFWLVGLATRVR